MLHRGYFTWDELDREDIRTVATFLAHKLPSETERVALDMPSSLMSKLALAWARGDVAADADEIRAMERRLLELILARPVDVAAAPGPDVSARVLCRRDRAWRDEVLREVGAADPAARSSIRRHILEFDELASLPQSSLALVLKGVSPDVIGRALGPEDAKVRLAMLIAVGDESAAQVRRHLPPEGARPNDDGPRAQERVLARAAALIDEGRIPWPDSPQP